MSICVGSYTKKVFTTNTNIFVVYREENLNEPIACIEMIGDTLVQAKLKYNRLVRTDKDILSVVMSWVKENRYEIATSDILQKSTNIVVSHTIDEDRLDLYNSLVGVVSTKKTALPENPQAPEGNDDEFPF